MKKMKKTPQGSTWGSHKHCNIEDQPKNTASIQPQMLASKQGKIPQKGVGQEGGGQGKKNFGHVPITARKSSASRQNNTEKT